MVSSLSKRIALLASASLVALTAAVVPASAQDSGALLDALIRKGILSDQEAEEIRADLTRENASALPKFVAPGGKSTTKLSFSGRIQAQYDGLSTDVKQGDDPSSTSHFFLRRIYLGAKAELGPDWGAQITYDFAGSSFDAAFVQYTGLEDHTIDLGLRKVNFGYEERISGSSLKAIERSGVTRYFVEDNNARRLGAGSYRIGAYIDGAKENFFYGAAITNPERVGDSASSSGIGSAANNNLAFWGNAGLKGKFASDGKYTAGVGLGYLPEQGGVTTGTGNDLLVASIYSDVTVGKFNVIAEVLWANNENARQASVGGGDANSWGFYIQPAFKLNDKVELVARYSYLDTDGHGVRISDGVRNAPTPSVNYDTLSDYYLGFNYYFQGNDVKLSAGFVYGKADDRISSSGSSSLETVGIRSQIQVNF